LTIGGLGSVIGALLLMRCHPGDMIKGYIAIVTQAVGDEAIGVNSAAISLPVASIGFATR
jgi:hypothetical protein